MNAFEKPEARFEYELEVFRRESDEAVQHLYAYLTMHAVAADHTPVRQLYNSAPLFWLTVLRALQTSIFIVLGRIFSLDSEHNINSLLRIAEKDQIIFSRESLKARRHDLVAIDIEKYVSQAFVPTSADFRALRREVNEWRRIYEGSYRTVRNQIFAHAEVSQPDQVGELFAKTTVRELELLVTDLVGFHSRLQNLLLNGFAPVASRGNSSVQEIRALPPRNSRYSLQARVTNDTERAVLAAANGAMDERIRNARD